MYQFTFWFVYVVYVFDFFVFFWRGNRWNFDGLGIPSEGPNEIFLFWCGDFATVWRGERRDLE